MQFLFGKGILTCDPSIDHPDFIVCSFMENSIGLKSVNLVYQCILAFIMQDEQSWISCM